LFTLTLLGEAAKSFKALRDSAGELRAKREAEVVKGIRTATEYDVGHNRPLVCLTDALTSLGNDRDGWGVALLLQVRAGRYSISTRILNPHFLSQMVSREVASNFCLALGSGDAGRHARAVGD